ncbi:uncharacterized protein LOC112094424 [Morus notabilis]|uniref:uncharacterized protein LOC112094424 n=1 Tax=Morus notabilis TaxID=981085 RepID=UPI000CED7ACE|nr:uncharacterized protein LOC112094424 [Morus notabilis]
MARGGQNNNNKNNRFQLITPTFSSTTTSPSTDSSSHMDNIHSPFFLHSRDHPGLALVSHVLTGPNYNTWSCSMLMAPNAKNKLGFINDSFLQPQTTDPTLNIWSRCNSMVTSWILNVVSKEIADSLLYLDNAQAPIPICHCGGMKAWMDYQQQEYVMQFLMGLNESYAGMRGQILMIDPLPFVSKVFNLVVQEER